MKNMNELLKANGLKCKLEEQSNGVALFTNLTKEDFTKADDKGNMVSTYEKYKVACENLLLYLYSNRFSREVEQYDSEQKKVVYAVPTNEQISNKLALVFDELGLDKVNCNLIKANLDLTTLIVHKENKQKLTASASAEVKALNKQLKAIEELETPSNEEKAELKKPIQQKIDDIKAGNNYEQNFVNRENTGRFIANLERRFAYIICNMEYVNKFATDAERRADKAWSKKIAKASELGITTEKIESYVKAGDFDGLKQAIKDRQDWHKERATLLDKETLQKYISDFVADSDSDNINTLTDEFVAKWNIGDLKTSVKGLIKKAVKAKASEPQTTEQTAEVA